MTKREREQVVELLRCAAEHVITGNRPETALTITTETLFDWQQDNGDEINRLARHAEQAVCASMLREWMTFDVARYERLLEAAARVEEGSYP